MKKGIKFPKSRIVCNDLLKEGQSIEEMVKLAINSKEPIKATAKCTYNDRKDGVLPQHDIRTDRFEIAMMATDKIHASAAASRHKMDYPETTEKPLATNGGEA